MTRTSFENKITMGNILQALAMIVAIVAAYSSLQAEQVQLARQTESLTQRADAGELRLRALEQSGAIWGARYESLVQSMSEVKAEIRQTNELLRRLIPGADE